jgi:hypothetical protein
MVFLTIGCGNMNDLSFDFDFVAVASASLRTTYRLYFHPLQAPIIHPVFF